MLKIEGIKTGIWSVLLTSIVSCGGAMDEDALLTNEARTPSSTPAPAEAPVSEPEEPTPTLIVVPVPSTAPSNTPTSTPSIPVVTVPPISTVAPIPTSTPVTVITPIPTVAPNTPVPTVTPMPTATPIVEPSLPGTLSGAEIYDGQCVDCHGEDGNGNFPLDPNNTNVLSLATIVENTMPYGSAEDCIDECALAVAEHIASLFTEEPATTPTATPTTTPTTTPTPVSPTPEPPVDPVEPQQPNANCDFDDWQSGTIYKEGDIVVRDNTTYTCLIGPWCGSPADWAYAPGSGLYWQEAWEETEGECAVIATATPVATPTTNPTTTPTSTPIATPTITPVVTPSAVPSATPTATPPTPTATPVATPTTMPTATPTPQGPTGAELFSEKCVGCHTAQGLGGELFTSSKIAAWETKNFAELLSTVESMPVQNCDDECITNISTYIWEDRWGFTITEVSAPGSGVRGVRLLTPFEYKNSIQDILSVALSEDELPEARFTGEFKYPTQAETGQVLVDNARKYQALAQTIVERVNLTTLGCDSASCSNTAFLSVAEKLFRRPLSNAEQTRYLAVKNNHSVNDALQSLLMSPFFLYRIEIGVWDATAQRYVLNDYEIASLLAFSLWGTSPDQNLLNAAANDQLSSVEQIQSRVENMINDARFIENFTHFMSYYSNTYGDTFEKSGLTESVIAAMKSERSAAMNALFTIGNGTFGELFNPGFTYVNSDLASHYGFVGNFSNQMTQVATDKNRGGILHQGLTHILNSDFSATSLVKRGKMIRENMLCHIMGVPSGVDPATIELPSTPITTRERWDVITGENASDGQCWECHQLMNEPGSALENFDQTGKFRTQEIAYNVADSILDIDTAGTLRANNGFDTIATYQNARDLSEEIAQSDVARACFVDSMYRFVSGHDVDAQVEDGIGIIQEDFIIDGDIASMITKLLTSDFALQRENRN